jgi:hypothetical protein
MLPMVDVRDLASAHIVPLIDPFLLANNGRYLICTKSMWLGQVVEILNDYRSELGIGRLKARKLTTVELQVASLFINRRLRDILPFLNHTLEIESSAELIKALQRWDKLDLDQPITIEKSFFEMARQLIQFRGCK